MVRLSFLVTACIFGLLYETAKSQSVKGGSRGVKGGSNSGQHHHSQRYTSQVEEEPVQRQSYSQSYAAPQFTCDRPSPPMNGMLACQKSNNRYTCTGSCNPGFKFPDDSETLELDCQLNGVWHPYRNFPDCVGSYGGGYQSSNQRAYSREYSHSSSSSQHSTQRLCGSPKSPMNGRHYCSIAIGQWTCRGTCSGGYQFPDGNREMTLTCNERDGVWLPDEGFPDCILMCHPECQNGGQCTVHNQCICPSTHRGNRCQYPVYLCDFNRISSGSLYSDCNHGPEYTECRISCPPGMTFQPPTTSVYRCTVDGHWNPPTTPECVEDSLCERPLPPVNGRIECKGNADIMLCRAECLPGYLFPQGFSELTIQCVRRTGEWSPDIGFPDCEPVCHPGCENGGRCLGHNKCLCTQGYRGERCQYPTSNCDGHDRFASVVWKCKNDDQETVCTVSCGPTGGILQPPEPTLYKCDLDGTWRPDLKPICIPDYSVIDRRSSHDQHHEFGGDGSRRVSNYETPGHGMHQRPHEFGGQQPVDYDEFAGQQPVDYNEFGGQQPVDYNEFGGQQPVDYNFGGQKPMNYDFGGQKPVDHNFGGQQTADYGGQEPDDYGFNTGNQRLNLGGYPEDLEQNTRFPEYVGQKPLDYEDTLNRVEVNQVRNLEHTPLTRQEAGKEAFDTGFKTKGLGGKDTDSRYELEREDADDIRNEIDTETEGTNVDIFSNIDRVSTYHGICSVWGFHHYRSFDGGLFTFPSSCPYVLVSSCNHEDLVISMLAECDHHAACERTIGIQLQENRYMLSYDRGLMQDQMSLPIPIHVGDLTVEKIARYIVARLTMGFSIWINEENTVLIVASPFMKNKTCGMCGNYDGYLDPKFIKSDSSKTDDIYSFANSWRRDTDGICVDNIASRLPCSADTREKSLVMNQANLRCYALYNPQFHKCAQKVNISTYYDQCQMDCCSVNAAQDCECPSIAQFVLECSRLSPDMTDEWRQPGLCPMVCMNGTEYRECGPPCTPTCDDKEPTCQQERCVDGCHCPEGTVLEKGQCITVDKCPCHHGEKIYESGETMEQDCNTCVCQGGSWQCTESICPATCSVSGPHIQTFDGLNYDFYGLCTHYLVDGEDFNVQIDYNNNCREQPSLMSVCIRSITIHTEEGAIVKLKQTMEVSVNGREMLSLPVLAPGIYVGQATSKYIKAYLTNGLEILWDMDSSIQIYAPVSLFNELKGLCGTFTKNQHDDFLTPEGDIEEVHGVFGQKWRAEENCKDILPTIVEQEKPCDRAPERRSYAARICSSIKGEDFQDCHSVVDYQLYYEECLEDVCGCLTQPLTCTCQSLSNYANACARKGKSLSWRQAVPSCGIPCPRGQIYQSCANPCTYSCSEIAHSYSSCREDCVEGCVCPPGQTLDVHGKCVPVSSCSCVHSGHVYPPEFLQRRGKEMCECAQGQWACHEATPEDILLTPPPHVAPDCNAADNLESSDCVSDCPLTCANLHHHQPCTTSICVPGCRCKKGYIMDTTTGKCVRPGDCPCHHSGKSYEEGEQVTMDCHACTCESGTWNCDSNPCPGLCSAWGDSHYETFDGRLYDFDGSCDYVMVKAHASESDIFSVVIQNIPCAANGGATCGKSLAVTLGSQSVVLTRDHPLPEIFDNSRLTVSSFGMYVLVDSDIGLSVQWDRNTKIYVIAQPIWKNKLQGLCGDFNGDSSDDFKSPSGGVPLVLAKDFADSWRVHKYCKPAAQTEDKCDINPERRTWSKHRCAVLKSEIFKPCHYQVDVEDYFKRCVQDACACNSGGDCECFCAVVSAYAQKCARQGVTIEWRSQNLCPIQCDSCDRYNPCISLCSPPNCDTYLEDSAEHSCSRQPCVDGCEPKPCETGQVHQSSTNLTCIPEEFCKEKPCTVIDGRPYREGERIENANIGDECQSCYCKHGEVDCVGVPCTSSTPRPTIGIKMEACEFTGWTDWINSVDPLDNGGDDFEDLEDLVNSQRIPCSLENITSIQCRVAETQEPSEATEQDVMCDLENGLTCKHSYDTGICPDYEVRVYCRCHEEVTCPPGQEWDTCAFNCKKLCHSMETYLDEEGTCDRNQDCVPGCVREVCEYPKFTRDAETCVTPDMCTCRLDSGYILAPGEVKTDGCQKCQCLNNTLMCSTTLECKGVTEVIAPQLPEKTYITVYEPFSTPGPLCHTGWSEWQSLHLPDRKGETESLEDLEQEELLSCTLDQVSDIQCREVKTLKLIRHSGDNDIYCDLRTKGLECKNKYMPNGQRCPDFEIRAYCDCEVMPAMRPRMRVLPGAITQRPPIFVTMTPPSFVTSTTPAFGIITTTSSCSYWSDWINKNKPRRGKKHGDKEDTKPYILKQTEGFCLEGYVSAIECKEANTGKDYTETNEEKLVCNVNKGFQCLNKHQPDNRCNDYKIRYFCTCGEGKKEVHLPIRTTPTPYIYPCSELIPLINGPKPLPDSQIKASSSESFRSGPDAIKIGVKGSKRAWTAARSDAKQFVEVNLGDVRAIYGVVTKGKEDADEWVTSYQLLYSSDGASYSYYQDENDINKVFSGNYDDTIEVKHVFSKPFEARYVRLEPLTWEEKISLQMDLLGCAEAITTTTEVPYEVIITHKEECREPMGLESGDISGISVSASSFYNSETTPENGRMGSDTAWVAGEDNEYQYFQVNFLEDTNLTGIITKGRSDVPQWVRSYMIAYTTDGRNWKKLSDENGLPVEFPANSDGDTKVTNILPYPIRAEAVRILPRSWKNKISMQVELLGCRHPVEEEEEEERTLLPRPPARNLRKECNIPMGLENGLLMDSQLSASSSYSSKYTPDQSRLGSDSVWAAAEEDDKQYLQVDFVDPQRVAGIITKGREDVPQWVTAFTVDYSNDGTVWNSIKNVAGDDKEFPANYDAFSTVENLFPSLIRTRFLRIKPTKWKNWISMQIELLGCYHPEPCRDPMGIENGLITNHQLTASSEKSESLSADDARLQSPKSWSPTYADKQPYIQVDFLEPTNLTGIITKGSPETPQWVENFYVAYSNDSTNWRKVLNPRGKPKEFTGNEDQNSPVINLFPMTVTARYIRVIPLTWHRWIALRMELLGCYHEKECLEPMGMENGVLSDAQITASSSFDVETTPEHARISDKSGWQPNRLDKHPYLQIDFLDYRNISGVVTKGMEDEDNWVTRFKVTISDDGMKWYPIITDDGDDVEFIANEDRDTPVVNLFPEAMEARYFRIVPLDFHKAVGLRVELLGCYHPYECQEPMGMESGSVLDFQISASSYLSGEFSPINARLDSDTSWVAEEIDDSQYIQVDFMVPTNITGIMTRGRNDANEWVSEYEVLSSVDGEIFFKMLDEKDNPKKFPANSDSETTVTNIFEEPINARFLRILPTAYEKKISMRFEAIGCFHKTECMEPMGLENGLLSDSHITGSSYKSDSNDPTKVRLDSDSSWIPASFDEPQFVQVDFSEPRNISAVVTKGDKKEPLWVTAYQVAFSEDDDVWTLVEDEKGNPIEFPGNKDNDSPVINVLPETIEARYVKIIPTDWKNGIALRVEILGCYHPYEEPTEEYTTTVIPEFVLPLGGIPTEPTMVTLCSDRMEPEISLLQGARIMASSSAPNGDPSRVPINTQGSKEKSGGWVPRVDDLHPVLLIEFPEEKLVTSIHIQGREDEENWVKSLRVLSSDDNIKWMPVFGQDGEEEIKGNEDREKIVTHYFKDPVEAKLIKIIPETWHKWPSFRLDLKGCPLPEVSRILPEITAEYPELCPELENYPELQNNCPDDCREGQLCNGEECVDPVDCVCVHEGQIFKVGDMLEDQSCRQCVCALRGRSYCTEKHCDPCEEGKTQVVLDNCTCSCQECEEDEQLCPTSMECIPKQRWCDGIVDCPDDETNCFSTTTEIPAAGKRPISKKKIKPIAPAILPTEPPVAENDTCVIRGKHINTFDGQDIMYEVCNHIVMKDIKNEKFNITIHKECGFVSECKQWIEVNYLKQRMKVLSDLSVEVNGHIYSTAQLWRLSKKTFMNLLASKVGEQVIIRSVKERFKVIYDIRGQLEIEASPELNERVSGLCGYYSGELEDDQRKPNGRLAFTSQEFGHSWAVDQTEKECKPLLCPHEEMKKALELCHNLKEDPFIPCGKILPLNQFIEFCMSSTCECLLNKENSERKCKCDSLLPFVESCESRLGPLAVRNWRIIHECHAECPPGMEWNDCGPSCQLTCDSASADTVEECSGKCVPGCFCPPGTVLNHETCIPPEQCGDQVCQGFGDPHFRTFDGLFFPFQGIGSFLIVSDTDNNFAVMGLSKKCGLFTPITCLFGLEISYKHHRISIMKRKEIKVDGKKIPMDKLPLHKDGMVVLGYPGRTFVVVIPHISLEARYYEENSGFAVKVPSRKYFNKTKGLCGNCNGKKDDELLKEPIKDYVCSWQSNGDREECMASMEELPKLTERTPICEKLHDPVFEACHLLVDVNIYVDACNFDATHSGDSQASFCKTAMEYGRQCCEAGINIKDWPKELDCDVDCPSGMQYEQCHKGCPQTCVSVKNDSSDPSCSQLETDGCFCPEGKVLKDDSCVDVQLCKTCDEEGHVPGDRWNDGECKHCHCKEDLGIECVLEVCPTEPICSRHEVLVKKQTEQETASCCESYICVPKEEECPTMEVPDCKSGEVAKVHSNFNSCPILKCECDPLLCAPLVWPEDLDKGQETVIVNDSCCPAVKVICLDESCPEKPVCDRGLELVEIEGECCTTYKCKPPKDVCVYTHLYKVVDGIQSLVERVNTDVSVYQPGEEWNDGLCEKCSCVESKGQYVPLCIMDHCPSVDDMPENKDYVLQEITVADRCCPDIFKVKCRDDDGNTYEAGEQWQDEDNPCISFLCEQDGPDVVKTKSVLNCTECPRTAVLFPPSKTLGQCCGICKVTKCEDGDDLYEIGDTWISADDKCKMVECVSEYGRVKTVYTKQPCPIIPEECPPDKIVMDENGCCKVCNLTSEISCSTGPIPESDTIGFFTYNEPAEGGICVNDKPVEKVLQCKGACHSRSYYSLEDGVFKDMCQCCKVNITVNRTIELRCPNGNYIRKTFLQPDTCQCSKCAPKSGETKKNNFNTQSLVPQSQWEDDSDFAIVQKPSSLDRFTQQKNEQEQIDSLNSWQFQQNQVQQEEDYDF